MVKYCASGIKIRKVSIEAKASTVAYWPLTQANGVRTTTETVFANEGDGGTMDAVPATIRAWYGSINKTEPYPCTDDYYKYFPIGTNAFPAAFGVYDPVANVNKAAATGLYFDSYTQNWWKDKKIATYPGVLRVVDPDALKLTTFTVEFFLRPDASKSSLWQFITAMPYENVNSGTTGKESWSVGINNASAMYVGYTTTGDVRSTYVGSNVKLFDDRWHHFALTVSGTSLKMYFDYVLVGTKTLPDEIVYKADSDLFIGGTTHSTLSYYGQMAHFRISDGALTSDKFLHFTRTERAADEANDVALHINFETVDGISTNNIVFNQAATGSAVHLSDTNNTKYAKFDADVYTNKLYGSRRDFKGFANAKSFRKSAKDSTGEPYLAWLPDDDVFHDSSFTVEMFVKIATGYFPQWTNLFKRNYENQSNANAMQFWIGNNSGSGILHCGFYSGGITDGTRIDDFNWHHIAVVFDKATNKLRYYRDWQQVGVDTSITETIKELTTPIYILGHDTAYGYLGRIDEVRITKRALTVKEFLSPEHAKGLIIVFH